MESSEIHSQQTLLDRIPQYNEIINDLTKGNLKSKINNYKKSSKLCYKLSDLLYKLCHNNTNTSTNSNNVIDNDDEKDNNQDNSNNNNKCCYQSDELAYFILFMDNNNLNNYIKFLLDCNNFKNALIEKKIELISKCDHHHTNNNNLRGNISEKNAQFLNDDEYVDSCQDNCRYCLCDYYKMIECDALAIFKKYISKDAPYSINASNELISCVITNICPENEDKHVELNCFDCVKQHIFEHIEKNYYDKYINSEYRCKYLLSTLKNRSLELNDVLYDDFAIVFLLEYLEQQNVSDLLKFWMQAENFYVNLKQIKENPKYKIYYENNECFFMQIQSDAMIIYDNYISLQAKSPIGFDKHVRLQVELNICQTIEKQNDFLYLIDAYSNCFYLPQLIVYLILEKIYFKKFLSSTMYIKYMNELFKTSQFKTNTSQDKRNNEKSGDNNSKSSQDNISLKEPLLDGGSSNNMDLLWQRPQKSNKMQIGHIDSLGRYITQLESEPSSLSNASKTSKKQTIKPINKIISSIFDDKKSIFEEEDEETALRIAEMLVNDIIKTNGIDANEQI